MVVYPLADAGWQSITWLFELQFPSKIPHDPPLRKGEKVKGFQRVSPFGKGGVRGDFRVMHLLQTDTPILGLRKYPLQGVHEPALWAVFVSSIRIPVHVHLKQTVVLCCLGK